MSKIVLALVGVAAVSATAYGFYSAAVRDKRGAGEVQDSLIQGQPLGESLPEEDSDLLEEEEEEDLDLEEQEQEQTEPYREVATATSPPSVKKRKPTKSRSYSSRKFFFVSVDDFKKKINKSPCVKWFFREGVDISKGSEITKDNKPLDDKFFSTLSKSSNFGSCLHINWRKASQVSQGKWTGQFSWTWSFIKGHEGFVSFNFVEPAGESKLKFTGAFYLVEKTKKPKSEWIWEAKYKKEVNGTGKVVDVSEVKKYFPKKGPDLKRVAPSVGDYWDFMNQSEDVKNMCKTGSADCPQKYSTPQNKRFKWNSPRNPKREKMDGWATSLDWWNDFYGISGYWSLKDKIPTSVGAWEEEQL